MALPCGTESRLRIGDDVVTVEGKALCLGQNAKVCFDQVDLGWSRVDCALNVGVNAHKCCGRCGATSKLVGAYK